MPQVASNRYITRAEKIFDCSIKIKIPAHYGDILLDECFDIVHNVNALYNSYVEGSYFNRINKNAGNWVETDFNTIQLISILKDITNLTDGAFDITSMPLIRVWGFYTTEDITVPLETEIKQQLKNVDAFKVETHNNSVKVDKNQEILTGAFVKAFATDQVIQKLKNEGIKDAIVNAGGSTIYALSTTKEHWKINVPHPLQYNDVLLQIPLQNSSFSLSSTSKYDRVIDGERYSHIINAKTGYPSQTLQVGVVTDSAFLGDILSTALHCIEAKYFNEVAAKIGEKYNFCAYRIDEDRQYRNYQFNPKQTIIL